VTPGDVIQSELDARWAWERLREQSERLTAYVKQPPETLSAEDRQLITLMARLILGAMWNAHATGDLSRLRPPPAEDHQDRQSAAALARRLAELLQGQPPASSDT
jgi:hypothetical protein